MRYFGCENLSDIRVFVVNNGLFALRCCHSELGVDRGLGQQYLRNSSNLIEKKCLKVYDIIVMKGNDWGVINATTIYIPTEISIQK